MNRKKTFNCPGCAAKLSIPKGVADCTCPKCGQYIPVGDTPAPRLASTPPDESNRLLQRAIQTSQTAPVTPQTTSRYTTPVTMPFICGIMGRILTVTFWVVLIVLVLAAILTPVLGLQIAEERGMATGFFLIIYIGGYTLLAIVALALSSVPLLCYHILRVLIATHNKQA